MSELSALSDPQALPQALACVGELEQLLEQEFEALKAQELDRFEALVQNKTDMLHRLGSITGIQDKADADQLDTSWDGFRAQMQNCRQLHQRNEILLIRKLDAIRGALDSLQMSDPTSSLEVYDRLGKVRRARRSSRGYSEV
jgi:flagellar biosynthesis/type III secretory pathway chaperone